MVKTKNKKEISRCGFSHDVFFTHVNVSNDNTLHVVYKEEGKRQGVCACACMQTLVQVTLRGCMKPHCKEDQRPWI